MCKHIVASLVPHLSNINNHKDDSKEACFCESVMFELDYKTLKNISDDWLVTNIEGLKVQTKHSTKQTFNLLQ